ncbi:MAG: hypothetical protein ACUVTR_06810 [Dehalococcoidia bacterium]
MKKGDVLKVVEGIKCLPSLYRREYPGWAARELGISLSHTKRLARRLKKAKEEIDCLFYQRTHPVRNRLPAGDNR